MEQESRKLNRVGVTKRIKLWEIHLRNHRVNPKIQKFGNVPIVVELVKTRMENLVNHAAELGSEVITEQRSNLWDLKTIPQVAF